MSLQIDTYSNVSGGHSLFKALGHPMIAEQARALVARIGALGPIAIYDPFDHARTFAALHNLHPTQIREVYARNHAEIGTTRFDCTIRPVTELGDTKAGAVLVAAFDSDPLLAPIQHLLPTGTEVLSLDALRLPDEMLTNRTHYLDPLNFATNFALLREAAGHHTRVVTANYWHRYGARDIHVCCLLMDGSGNPLASWRVSLPDSASALVIDSQEVATRFRLGPYTGSLFLHAVNIAGHDVIKYALDTYGDDTSVLSCTHDANAWPAERYAGLPAPADDEQVLVWVQNSHPCPIPANSVGLNLMGDDRIAWFEEGIEPFATRAIDVSSLLPDARWPRQIEIRAGKSFVRPRYEVVQASGRRRMAHANVERTDLQPNPELPALTPWFGKGYLLPAPVLPPARYSSQILPTPMSTAQDELPVMLIVYDPNGHERVRHGLGRLPRDHATSLEVVAAFGLDAEPGFDYGHMELCYDFSAGGVADGWLHALFRYRDRSSGHTAETSFGAHIFNTTLVYRDEPQSYSGRPPGLSTRLFLRLGEAGHDTLCHLIYPASTRWNALSDTRLLLHDAAGNVVAERVLRIPCSGSRLWRYSEIFDQSERAAAGRNAYVLVRDTTCRLFGYHGLLNSSGAFSFDHMFGF